MGSVADFGDDFAAAARLASEPFWFDLYKTAYPTLVTQSVVTDAAEQQAEVDRILTLADRSVVRVEEKYDSHTTGNLFLEYWSVREQSIRGWVCRDDLACDILCYFVRPSAAAYLFDAARLRVAWRQNGKSWVARFGAKEKLNSHRGGYTTVGVAVPAWLVCDAVEPCSVVRRGAAGWIKGPA